jgi:hypothetical protein
VVAGSRVERRKLGLAVSTCNIYFLLDELDIELGPSRLSCAGTRVSGTRTGGTSSNPMDPMGRDFSSLVSLWGASLPHP